MFELDRRLQEDCLDLGGLELCRLLLMNDRTYPWFILVPERPGITEIYHLPDRDQWQLLRESSALARAMAMEFNPDKLNIAAIGNLVPQLHMHHIARRSSDPAWPGVVWGGPRGAPYECTEVEWIRVRIGDQLEQFLRTGPSGG
jgi:diadenosine tetraphosphate (Ap4A) HIT family hydrolase